MNDALIGIASGMLAASAVFGIASQIVKRQSMHLGAQIAGLLGSAVLLVALLAHGITAASLDYFLDTSGRALSIASISLLALGLPALRDRSLATGTHTGLCWAFALAAILTGWAEFCPTVQEIPTVSHVTSIALLVASGLAMAACSQALAALQSGTKPETRSGPRLDSSQAVWRRPPFYATMFCENKLTHLTLATAIVLLILLGFSVQSFIESGFFWPTAASFRAIAGAWLILFSACLVKDAPAGSILEIAGPLVLTAVALSGI